VQFARLVCEAIAPDKAFIVAYLSKEISSGRMNLKQPTDSLSKDDSGAHSASAGLLTRQLAHWLTC
jgi:hypothetical protein